jgi:predicted AAA+ superfamily ATPase
LGHFVCIHLINNEFIPYYYNQRKHGEVEFIVESKSIGSILPIETKSGSDYKKHNALDYIMKNNPKIPFVYVFCNENIKVVDKIIYAPIYCCYFLNNK